MATGTGGLLIPNLDMPLLPCSINRLSLSPPITGEADISLPWIESQGKSPGEFLDLRSVPIPARWWRMWGGVISC